MDGERDMKEFKSFYKTVQGNEGNKCNYPTRLDTYGCGCAHDCKYCYAKSLLDFRGMWDPEDPAVAPLDEIEKGHKDAPEGGRTAWRHDRLLSADRKRTA